MKLNKEQVTDLQETFHNLERKKLSESFGAWFNFPISDEKLVEKATSMLDNIEIWQANWKLVLSAANQRLQSVKDAELLEAIERMSEEERINLFNKLKNQPL